MAALVQSVARASEIMRALAAGGAPASLAELSARIGLPKTTTHGLVQTLREVGFVEQDARSGRYAVASGLLGPGTAPLDVNVLRAQALHWTDTLAARSGEAALLATLDGDVARVVHHVLRPGATDPEPLTGRPRPLHASALGLVLLAHDPRARRAAAGPDLVRLTRSTVTDRDRCEQRLAEVRRQGWAAEVCEAVPDRAGLAAPVRDASGAVVAAVGIEGHLERLCDRGRGPRAELVDLVVSTARSVGRALGDDRS